MAPIRSVKRTSGAPKPRMPTSYPTRTDTFSTTKADKRSIKHSLLVSKIKSSGASDSNRVKKAGEKNLKRRRPNKKLVATLDSLVDALPELESEAAAEGGKKRQASGNGGNGAAAAVVQANQSLKSKPGVMKKRAQIEEFERKRFGMNIAMMNTSSGAGTATDGSSTAAAGGVQNRWEALKRHVQGNMEKKPEFAAK